MNYSDLIGKKLGQFELLEVIGVGGMGAVFRAHQSRLGRDVAVKVLPAELGIEQTYIDRFIREAETVATLEHSHIIPIYGFDTQDKITYVAMRLLTGGSLMDRLAPSDGSPQKLPSATEASQLLTQIAGALDYAHSQGIIHRDIKPGNIMFDHRGEAFLVDFGIAKLMDATQALTAVGTTMGTPIFMAPEQWRTESVAPNTDQYAMGVLMYFTLVGTPPFQAATPYMLMQLHLDAPAPSINRHRGDLPEEVAAVIGRALEKYPEDRFPSMQAFATAFDQAIQGITSEPTLFFRPQGNLADTNQAPKSRKAASVRDTIPRRYTAQPTTPSSGIRVPDEDTLRRNPPPSVVETQQTAPPTLRRSDRQTAWYKSPMTWLLLIFIAIFGGLAIYFISTQSNDNDGLSSAEQTQTVQASKNSNPEVTEDSDSDATEADNPPETVEPSPNASDETNLNETETPEEPAHNQETGLLPTTTPIQNTINSPTITLTMQPETLRAKVNGDQTNVRAGPGVSFSIVESLNQGDDVDLYIIDNDWAYIGFDDRFAWVYVDLLDITGNTSRLPAAKDSVAVRCPLPRRSDRYNSEWSSIFWELGCPMGTTVVQTTASIQEFGQGNVIERQDTGEVLVVLNDDSWVLLPSIEVNIAEWIGNEAPQATSTSAFYIRTFENGYIYDFDDETDAGILIGKNRLNKDN